MKRNSRYWDDVAEKPCSVDPLVLSQKRDQYLKIINTYIKEFDHKVILKTDLYDEALADSAFFAQLSSGNGTKLLGMDISKSILKQAAGDFFLINSDVLNIPIKDNSVDIVISPSTLDHFDSSEKIEWALLEIARVLKKGGQFVLIMDNRTCVFYWLLKVAFWFKILPFYLGKTYTVAEAKRGLNKAGFDVHDASAIIHNPRVISSFIILCMRKIFKASDLSVRRFLQFFEKLENKKTIYFTGCFIALKAVKK